MKAYVFGGMLVLSAALAACSSSDTADGAGGGSGGGTGEGGGGDGGSTTTGSPTSTTGTTTPATTSTTTTTTTGGGEGVCGTGLSFNDPALDACLDANCCTEFTACAGADGSNADACNACLEAGGGALCDDFVACADANACGSEGTGICDSGLSTQDAAVDTCLGDACCAEFQACTQNGADIDACIACFDAEGGPLCDAAIACGDESGCFGQGGGGICDSGLSTQDDAIDACLGDACCAEFQACTQNGADIDACIACFDAEGGPLCDAAIACGDESGCFM